MLRSTLSIFLILSILNCLAHPWKPKNFVIIDTDGGLDDFRAINLMLASPDVRILAITTSDGVLSARQTYAKLRAFLDENYHEGILTGANLEGNGVKNDCKAARIFKWAQNEDIIDELPTHLEIIQEVIEHTRDKITFVNLGSLNTFNSAFKSIKSLPDHLKEVLWASNYAHLNKSFNFLADSVAFQSLIQEKVILNLVNGNIENFNFENFSDSHLNINNNYTKNFVRSLSEVNSPFATQCYDETLVLYLHYPEYFKKDSISKHILSYNINANVDFKRKFINILNGTTINQNQVFSKFPMDTSYYSDDVKKIMPETIKDYGNDEWIATVMANEMHRHLGIYAVIGTKMGIRAREYFGAGIDEMRINSWAGASPPFSCMNDGLQISTGATLGHGLIKLEADSLKNPKAEFEYMDRKISIRLKDEYRKRIESEIKMLVLVYGLDSNLYWDLVRKFALDYWRYWDRHEIFELEKIK